LNPNRPLTFSTIQPWPPICCGCSRSWGSGWTAWWTGGRGTELLVEVLRFLGLVASAEGRLTPSETVDRGWHELILCTRTYGEFCRHHFGRMMHHEPGGDEGDNRRQFKETLRLYRAYFGAPPARFWHEPESPCGACEGAA